MILQLNAAQFDRNAPVLYVIVVVLLCIPLSGILMRVTDRLRTAKKKEPDLITKPRI